MSFLYSSFQHLPGMDISSASNSLLRYPRIALLGNRQPVHTCHLPVEYPQARAAVTHCTQRLLDPRAANAVMRTVDPHGPCASPCTTHWLFNLCFMLHVLTLHLLRRLLCIHAMFTPIHFFTLWLLIIYSVSALRAFCAYPVCRMLYRLLLCAP